MTATGPSGPPEPTIAQRPGRGLTGVRGLLLDLDGVLIMRGEPVPGAAGALDALARAAIPFLVITNASLVSRATLAADLQAAGLAVERDQIMSAVSASAAHVRREFGSAPLYVLGAPDALGEFEGLRLLSHDEAAAPDASVAAVVVGDAADDFTPRNLQSAFRLLRGGAAFVAMHKNRWWFTAEGPTLDAGPFVAALEFATDRRALVMGKPSRAFFAEALRTLRARDRRPGMPLRGREVAMVGDDVWNDVRGAQAAGLRGAFVRSGKHGDAELTRVATGRRGRSPDAVAPSIAEIVAAIVE